MCWLFTFFFFYFASICKPAIGKPFGAYIVWRTVVLGPLVGTANAVFLSVEIPMSRASLDGMRDDGNFDGKIYSWVFSDCFFFANILYCARGLFEARHCYKNAFRLKTSTICGVLISEIWAVVVYFLVCNCSLFNLNDLNWWPPSFW